MTYATTSSELVEQLRLHQLNCVIVNDDALAEDRSSFATALLFKDPMVLLVPADVPEGAIEGAEQGVKPATLPPAFTRFVEINANVPMRPVSDAWYRATLPFATPTFTAMTYVAAADIVAEGLATAHVPFSLLPSLPGSVRSRIRVYTLGGMDRSIVLAMPKAPHDAAGLCQHLQAAHRLLPQRIQPEHPARERAGAAANRKSPAARAGSGAGHRSRRQGLKDQISRR
ncbi:LysR substrate-binding domain-containing protein [Devosia ginsengisoli]|uniref:LysR substrate-binding domain-containing protein n=1 Tax=Devosia ginsengisoli TaxID=400770 RepID=UPI0026EC3F8A|nr:LysR substrate-binding domain-containing protein [Devosia ginsengisoli]MCR6671515.1 LysR substrate-binding domain-containing protein [Devosia ginsengisoli]